MGKDCDGICTLERIGHDGDFFNYIAAIGKAFHLVMENDTLFKVIKNY